MKKLALWLLAPAAVGLLSGCATTSVQDGQTSAAYSVGDRTRVTLDEVVVSLPLKGFGYQNLHVHLAVTVNPVKNTTYSASTVSEIVQRLESRINARVVEALYEKKQPALEDTPALRGEVAWAGQQVVDDAMRKWQHGSEYEVKVIVVSMYWTDASVGRSAANRRTWW
jgi:hypothetical protein